VYQNIKKQKVGTCLQVKFTRPYDKGPGRRW